MTLITVTKTEDQRFMPSCIITKAPPKKKLYWKATIHMQCLHIAHWRECLWEKEKITGLRDVQTKPEGVL